jgi:F-type H+-transporting ATPase subunit c
MYKKLANNSSFNFFSLISTITTSSVCFSFLMGGFFDFNSVFDLIFVDGKNTFLLATSEEVTSVNTEILARRIGSGLATAGLGGVGTGIGLVFSGLIKGFSRNPSLKDDLFSYAIFGFALTEAIGLFALMMAFMLLYA